MRRLRSVWAAGALVASVAIGLVATSAALGGGETCGTVAGDSFCAQLGKNGFADHLTLRNTGKGVISTFELVFPSGTTVTGVAGNAGCHQAANTVTCTTQTNAGASQTVDAIANVGVGTKVTLTVTRGSAKASSVLTMQATAEGTTTTTPPPTACEATLRVLDWVGGLTYYRNGHDTVAPNQEVNSHIEVKNTSRCTAKNVVADTTLPNQYTCKFMIVIGKQVACSGHGRFLRFPVGDLAPGAQAVIAIVGSFAHPGSKNSYTVSFSAYAKADNAAEESETRLVEVVLHSKIYQP